ncbi:zinc ABC transporter ATP-binding protein AztA [Actinoplanes derwentensis]|uniref:Zinc/manganese transport system ATP-binding protein n=1 Tax=Actinoplanes derwentensis TaxID=113562 RepID=A0A1H1VFY1_9ACTN|nr:zinc ABC transporter ATP-binding protein AztA [Actinoplanes derwentensis]GID83709.1 ABC transporter ATP-binding protein [Actinoplanes derwentensis]SDS83643.1 zinc/manganese transport system ATP-binding protein [Actinoplanes derwentensis]
MLTASHLGFRYAGIPVLHDVNLRAEPAAMLAVTGPNGSGKSTLLHLLAGVAQPAEGTVTRDPGIRVALLPQRTADIDALPLTVTECVRIGRFTPWRLPSRRDRAVVTALMERLDIAHLARRRLRELSGGQRQRTLIAQTFAQDAGVYILDEPTAALDTGSRHRVHELLTERVRDGAAIIMASHDDEESALADHTVRLAAPESSSVDPRGQA